jgi:hypothetical protein
MNRLLRLPLLLPLLLMVGACAEPRSVTGPVGCATFPALSTAPARVPATSPHDTIFRGAGEEFGVPSELLRAISYVETGWRMVEGREEHGLPPASGLMALRGERLARAAALAGTTVEQVRSDPTANVRAAAALLRAEADAGEMPPSADLVGPDWGDAVGRFSGIDLAAGRTAYVRDVLSVVGGHRSSPTLLPNFTAADPCAPTPPPPPPVVDFAGALWYASPNFNTRVVPTGAVVQMVIVHSCEGSYAGCWSWLANPASGVSAHYVVREDGAEITQLVREAGRAWHIGASYDPALNAGHAPHLHGVQSNHFTVGIEHAGYASQTTWPVAQIDASARLVCDISRRWSIPRDRLHIVSHGQLQPWNRTDPGAGWPWAQYMARIDAYCGA